MSNDAGSAHITLSVSPDPPRVGSNDFVVVITGVPNATLDRTKVQFSTMMPAMDMSGPAGAATRASDGSWHFTTTLGMASQWAIRLQLNGALTGTTTFRFDVGAKSTNSGGSTSVQPMAGMNMTGGSAAPWETAFFALLILVIVGYFVLRRDRRPVAIALGAAGVIAIAALALAQARYTAPTMDMTAMENVKGTVPVAVRTQRVHSGRTEATVIAPGAVSPYLTQEIVTRVGGILADFSIYNGDVVHAGEQIAFLEAPELGSTAQAAQASAEAARIEAMHHAPNDVRIAQNDIASARNDLISAQADVSAKAQLARYWAQEISRERMLLREGAVSQQEYQDEVAQQAAAQAAHDAARAHAASAQSSFLTAQTKASDASASVEQMQERYSQAASEAQTQGTLASYRSVTAPDDGVVIQRMVDPGTYVQAGTAIARIAVLNRLRIDAAVAQSDLSRVASGDAMDVMFSDGTELHGRVTSVAPVADPTSHTATVEAIVTNPRRRAQAGGFAHIVIHVRAMNDRRGIPVPSSAVVGGSMNPMVWIDRNGIAHGVTVHVLSDNGTTAIVSGLPSDASVVTDGAGALQEGQAITEVSP